MNSDRVQEIFARAVAGRTKRRLSWVHTFPGEGVKHVLGVHLGNTSVSVREENGHHYVDVSVDADLWCRDENETTVHQTTAQSSFDASVQTTAQVVGDREIQVTLADSPRSVGVRAADGQVMLSLEVDVAVEVIAPIRLWVRSVDLTGQEERAQAHLAEAGAPALEEQVPPQREKDRHKKGK
jgi:hypothetical protein